MEREVAGNLRRSDAIHSLNSQLTEHLLVHLLPASSPRYLRFCWLLLPWPAVDDCFICGGILVFFFVCQRPQNNNYDDDGDDYDNRAVSVGTYCCWLTEVGTLRKPRHDQLYTTRG